MRRRILLTGILGIFSGCAIGSETPPGGGQDSNPNNEPTVRQTDTPHISAAERFSFGDWTKNQYVAYRVNGVRLHENLYCEGSDFESDSYKPRGDYKIAIGEVQIKNIQQREHGNMLFRKFGFVTPQRIIPSQGSFTSENSTEIPFGACEIASRYDGPVRFPAYEPMKPGEKRLLYFASALPIGLSEGDISVAQKAATGNSYQKIWS